MRCNGIVICTRFQAYEERGRITDVNQPLLISQPKARDRRSGQEGPICLVPELCYTTGSLRFIHRTSTSNNDISAFPVMTLLIRDRKGIRLVKSATIAILAIVLWKPMACFSVCILCHIGWLMSTLQVMLHPSKALNLRFSKPQNMGYPVVFQPQNTFMMLWSLAFLSLESKQLLYLLLWLWQCTVDAVMWL